MKIRDEITGIIAAETLAPTPVRADSNLYTDLGFDSLMFVRLLLNMEEVFSISIDLMEMELCLRVDQLISLVESKVKEAGHDSTSADQPKRPGENRHN